MISQIKACERITSHFDYSLVEFDEFDSGEIIISICIETEYKEDELYKYFLIYEKSILFVDDKGNDYRFPLCEPIEELDKWLDGFTA